MAGQWLRLYTEIRSDRKLRRLSPAQRWLWVVILTIAKESPRPGCLLLSEGVPVTVEDLADDAAIPLDEVKSGVEAFESQNMLIHSGGVFCLVNWDKRQFVSDGSTDRVQKHRQKKRQSETLPKRYNAVSETPPETDYRQQTTETDLSSCLTTTTGQCPEADNGNELTTNESDSHPQAGEADVASKPPTNQELIAELTEAYRSVEGIKQAKGDYAFIGALYNQYSYAQVLEAINNLQMAVVVQDIREPLLYLKGILKKQERDPPRNGGPPAKVDDEQKQKKKEFIRSLYMS